MYKRCISMLVLGIILVPFTAKAEEKKWYEGGTLHKATTKEWNAASEENRLATTADFLRFLLKREGHAIKPDNPKLKDMAKAMEKLITKFSKESESDQLDIALLTTAIWLDTMRNLKKE